MRLNAADVLKQQAIVVEHLAEGDMRLLPHIHGTDGFYAAVLERRK